MTSGEVSLTPTHQHISCWPLPLHPVLCPFPRPVTPGWALQLLACTLVSIQSLPSHPLRCLCWHFTPSFLYLHSSPHTLPAPFLSAYSPASHWVLTASGPRPRCLAAASETCQGLAQPVPFSSHMRYLVWPTSSPKLSPSGYYDSHGSRARFLLGDILPDPRVDNAHK